MTNKTLRLFQIFSARLVLEVFGGAGAIWGFSEAVGLRTNATVWFWRPCALIVGSIFFLRWLMQIRDYIAEGADKNLSDIVEDSGEILELTADLEEEGSSYGSQDGVPTVIV